MSSKTNWWDKVLAWLQSNDDIAHFAAGFAIALVGYALGGIITMLYGLIVAATAAELKDYLWGGDFDWMDWAFTIAGGAACLLCSGVFHIAA